MTVKKSKEIHTVGKRKRAIARAYARPGTGKIKINGMPIENINTEYTRLMTMEPIILAEDDAKKIDIDVTVNGGGFSGKCAAARQAIAKAFVEFNPKLKQKFIDYDRFLLVSDSRRTEPHKPGPSKPRRHKQRSKR